MDLFDGEPAMVDQGAVSTRSADVDVPDQAGLTPPREMSFCLGHDKVEQVLLGSYNAGSVPHGLIFAGQKGIGKATMAYRFARFLLKNGIKNQQQSSLLEGEDNTYTSLTIDRDDPVFRRVISGGHADFMSVERAYDATKIRHKDNVAVDEIRKISSFLRMTASDGGWRVVIIDDADTMNRNAQNALLKILEEPPKNSILILITHRLGALIPTIRSRTQVHHFQPLARNHIHVLLQKHGVNDLDINTLCDLSEGSVGKAASYADEGGLAMLAEIMDVLNDYPDWDWTKIHAMADRLAGVSAAKAYTQFQDLLCWVFAHMVVLKARGLQQDLSDLFSADALQPFFRCTSLETLLKICDTLHDHFQKVRRANLDKRQAVLTAFSKIS